MVNTIPSTKAHPSSPFTLIFCAFATNCRKLFRSPSISANKFGDERFEEVLWAGVAKLVPREAIVAVYEAFASAVAAAARDASG